MYIDVVKCQRVLMELETYRIGNGPSTGRNVFYLCVVKYFTTLSTVRLVSSQQPTGESPACSMAIPIEGP